MPMCFHEKFRLQSIADFLRYFSTHVFFAEKNREREMVSTERRKIEENIDRLSQEIQKEEAEKEKKKQLFVEDLDNQVAEKENRKTVTNTKDKGQRFRETNELATKLNVQLNVNEPVITVS